MSKDDAITAGFHDARNGAERSFCVAAILSRLCPLWVRSRRYGNVRSMSALPLKADIDRDGRNVRFVPKADIAPNCSIVDPMSAETLAI